MTGKLDEGKSKRMRVDAFELRVLKKKKARI
jgi:hypothetical protein